MKKDRFACWKLKYAILCLVFTIVSFSAISQVDLVVSVPTCFSALDNNPLKDQDNVPGQITVRSLKIESGGSINSNDPGNACSYAGVPNSGALSIIIIVENNVLIEAGGAINTDNKTQGGNAGNISITVLDGTFIMEGPGSKISSSNLTATSGNMKAGNITIDVSGIIDIQTGATITAFAYKGTAGTIDISSEDNITIDGNVLSQSTGTGAGTNQGHGGFISITSGGNILVNDNGIVSSKGLDPGADLVHLCGCNVTIYGLVESTGHGHGIPSNPPNHLVPPYRPDKPANSTAGVEIWASNDIVIDNRNHNGQINADLCCAGGTNGTSWIDVFAKGSISILGSVDEVDKFAVHANGAAGNTDNGGVITVKSTEENVTAKGKALQADGTAYGGSIVVEAYNDVVLDEGLLFARGDSNPMGGFGKGGKIDIRSYNTTISWPYGIGDVRPTGTHASLPAANRGTIEFTKCDAAAVNLFDGSFPWNGLPATTPTTNPDECTGAPALADYVVFCECACTGGTITITKVVVGTVPAADWSFTSTIPGYANFTIDKAGGTLVIPNVPDNVYTITEVNQNVPGTLTPYTVTNTCGTGSEGTLTVADCNDVSCTFTNTEPPYCSWCSKGAVLSQVDQNMGSHCARPDIIVDLRLASTTVDATKVGTDQPATGSLQAAVDYMNNHVTGDFNGDGKLFIGVIASDCENTATQCSASSHPPSGDSPNGLENVIITNVHSERMNIFGCSVTIHAEDVTKPVITIRGSLGKVTVLDIHVKYSNVAGYLVDDNDDLVVVKNGRAMHNDIGYLILDDNVEITGSPQISDNRIGIQLNGNSNILRTNSDIRNNSLYGIFFNNGAGAGNESDGNEVGVSGIPNGTGIYIAGNNNYLHGDAVVDNTLNGIVVAGNSNTLDDEDAQENGGHGMLISGNNNTISDCRQVKFNDGNGMHVTGDNNAFEGNETSDNDGSGIFVDPATGTNNSFEDNDADDNDGYGIRACGQIDLLDNEGQDNGSDPQISFVCGGVPKFEIIDIDEDKLYKYDASFNLISSTGVGTGNTDGSDVTAVGTYTYVLDRNDDKVYRYQGGTNTVAVSRTLEDAGGNGLGLIIGIAIDGTELWVADNDDQALYRYSLTDAFTGTGFISANLVIPFSGNNDDADGLFITATHLYVLDHDDYVIYGYPRAGGAQVVSKILKENDGGGLGDVTGATLDGTNLYVVDSDKDIVFRYVFANLFTAGTTTNAAQEYALYELNDEAQGIAVGSTTNFPLRMIMTPDLVTKEQPGLRVYPNPFRYITTVLYNIKEAGNVTLTLYNSVGKEVRVIANSYQAAGEFRISLNTSDLPAGNYFIRMQTKNSTEMTKLIQLR